MRKLFYKPYQIMINGYGITALRPTFIVIFERVIGVCSS